MINNLHLKSRIYYLANALLPVLLFTPVISLSGIILSAPNCVLRQHAYQAGWILITFYFLPSSVWGCIYCLQLLYILSSPKISILQIERSSIYPSDPILSPRAHLHLSLSVSDSLHSTREKDWAMAPLSSLSRDKYEICQCMRKVAQDLVQLYLLKGVLSCFVVLLLKLI